MGTSNYSIEFSAVLGSTAGSVNAGDVLVLNAAGTGYVVATTGNAGTRRPGGIALTAGVANSSVIIQSNGDVSAAISGLGVLGGAPQYAVVTGAGRLARSAAQSAATVGYVDEFGNVSLNFSGFGPGITNGIQYTTNSNLAAGDWVCAVPSDATGLTVTKATPSAVATAGGVLGVVPAAYTSGATNVLISDGGTIGTSYTSLGTTGGAVAGKVVLSSSARAVRSLIPHGGEYVLGTTDTAGNITITPGAAIATSPKHVFNVKAYGALGDYDDTTGYGTDDVLAIEAAIAAMNTSATVGHTLYFPPGSYRISRPIQITRSIVIEGPSGDTSYNAASIYPDIGFGAFVFHSYSSSATSGNARGDGSIIRNLAIGNHNKGSAWTANTNGWGVVGGGADPRYALYQSLMNKTFNPYGRVTQMHNDAWINNTVTAVGTVIVPRNDNGYEYVCTVAGTTAVLLGSEPTWPTDSTPVVDNGATWVKKGARRSCPSWAAGTGTGGTAGVARVLGDHVTPRVDNGFVYICTTAGTGSSTEPSWPTTNGSTVADGTAVWTLYRLRLAGRNLVIKYRCISGTKSGATEPNWDLAPNEGDTITESATPNPAVWQAVCGDAITLFAKVTVTHVSINTVNGDGINCYANTSGTRSTNANVFKLDHNQVSLADGSGVFIEGIDANIGLITSCDSNNCKRFGFEDYSFLGNTYIGCHTAVNLQGPYYSHSVDACNQYFGCYSESDQPGSCGNAACTAFYGGLHEASTGADVYHGFAQLDTSISHPAWTAGAAKSVNDRVDVSAAFLVATPSWIFARTFVATVSAGAGLTGATEPTWTAVPGDLIQDGDITWKVLASDGSSVFMDGHGQGRPTSVVNTRGARTLTVSPAGTHDSTMTTWRLDVSGGGTQTFYQAYNWATGGIGDGRELTWISNALPVLSLTDTTYGGNLTAYVRLPQGYITGMGSYQFLTFADTRFVNGAVSGNSTSAHYDTWVNPVPTWGQPEGQKCQRAGKCGKYWTASATIALNDVRLPNVDNTYYYKATAIGSAPHQTGSTEPVWRTDTTPFSDGDITWTRQTASALWADYGGIGPLVGVAAVTMPDSAYSEFTVNHGKRKIVYSGTLSGTQIVTFAAPADYVERTLFNNTNHTLTFNCGAGADVDIATGKTAILGFDSTGAVTRVTADV